jgi:epoxyqueuosine reductase
LEEVKHTIKSEIKAEAERLGFSLFGITTPDPPAHLDIFHDWISKGFQGGMTYLDRPDTIKKRSDPRVIFPECKSVIMLGMQYAQNIESEISNPDFQIASYARHEDYHLVIPQRLKILSSSIFDFSSGQSTCVASTDSAPVLERDLAQRAGLGWIGKNSCLISPLSGSFFLLAEIFTNLELPPDEPFETDRCGNCRRCIEACPTGCIQSDRTLDARSCISYLTIEKKGNIPIHLRPKIGNWLFGCDICQSVCPWNKKILKTRFFSLPLMSIDPGARSLAKIIKMDENEFQNAFSGSPLLRSKRQGIIRNAAVVLGNFPDSKDYPVLENIIASETDPVIQTHTAWALKKSDLDSPDIGSS